MSVIKLILASNVISVIICNGISALILTHRSPNHTMFSIPVYRLRDAQDMTDIFDDIIAFFTET